MLQNNTTTTKKICSVITKKEIKKWKNKMNSHKIIQNIQQQFIQK